MASMQAHLPQEKLQNLQPLHVFSRKRSLHLRGWQSLIGHLSFASHVVCPGHPCICKLIDQIHGVSNLCHYVKITGEIHRDCFT